MLNNNRRRQNRSRKQSKRNAPAVDKVVSALKMINIAEKQQVRFGLPNTPDVPFPRIRQDVYTCVVLGDAFTITSSTTAAVSGAYAFSLSSLPSASSLTNAFDRYRVLHLQFIFNQQVSTPTGGGALITAIDYDDINTPSAELQQRDTAMKTPVGTYFERSLIPRIAVPAYGGSVFNQFLNASAENWMDTSANSVQYYGLKYFLPTQTTSATIYSISVRAHLQFKNNF